MKKQMLIIKIHSVVDVITNSSTELFIMQGKTQGSVEKILSGIFKKHGKSLDACCKPLAPLDYRNKKEIVNTLYDFRHHFIKKLKFDGSEFVLVGETDNSIPYEVMDEIENTFHCCRIHMG
jgi:hypothetical protein